MTKQELETTIAQLQAELAAKDATIEELKASKSPKTRSTKQAKEKVVERSVQKLHNSDYLGKLLTLHSHEEVLVAMSDIASFSDLPVYIKVAGRVLVNGQPETFAKLRPVVVDGDKFLLLGSDNDVVTPIAGSNWDEAWVVAMRPSAARRYYEGIVPEKKSK